METMISEKIILRPAKMGDADAIEEMQIESVYALNSRDYDPIQIEAFVTTWLSGTFGDAEDYVVQVVFPDETPLEPEPLVSTDPDGRNWPIW